VPIFKFFNKIAKFFYEEPPEKPEEDDEIIIPTGIVCNYPLYDPTKTILFDYEKGRTEVVDSYLLDQVSQYQDNPCDEPEPLNPHYSD
jgi:hypothetical protein